MGNPDFEEAVDAYRKYYEQNNQEFDEPSETWSEIFRDCIILKNSNGELAKYNLKTKIITI